VNITRGATVRTLGAEPEEGTVLDVGQTNAFVRFHDGGEESWPLRLLRPISTPPAPQPKRWWIARSLLVGRPM
jgi:hypothetical protein